MSLKDTNTDDFRIECYRNFVKNELVPWMHDQGFIKPDYEQVGLILCEEYKGEIEKFKELSERSTKTIQEAQAFLDKLKKKE